MLAVALYGCHFVDNTGFPDPTRPQFMIDLWLPEGTHIDDTAIQCKDIEKYLMELDHVTDVATVIGSGAPRFMLTYAAEKPNSSYAQFLVGVDDYSIISELAPGIQDYINSHLLDSMANLKLFLLGPGEGGKIQIRVTGSDNTTLRELSDKIVKIMEDDGNARGIRYDWREKVKTIRPMFSEAQARRSGITRPDLTDMMTLAYDGKQVSVYRERDLLLPIKVRAPESERADVSNLKDTQIWSPIIQKYIPVRQIAPEFDTVYDDSRVWRRNRKKTITVHCDQRKGVASVVLNRIWPKIKEIELPPGYFVERGGEYQDSVEAQEALASSIPLFGAIMILIVIFLFNALRQPLVIFLTVPLAIIGVTLGLLVTKQPFGFMALLGFLSLTGMLIKNSIVLIDQIDLEIKEGKDPFRAIMDSSVGRMRPVMMAAATTVLGMTPLLFDAFFIAMAVTIMFGLTFASILTLIVVPVFYAIFFKIKYNKEHA